MRKFLLLSLIISAESFAASICIVCPPGYDCSGDRPVAKTGDARLATIGDIPTTAAQVGAARIVPLAKGDCSDLSQVVLLVDSTARQAMLMGTAKYNRVSKSTPYNCFTIPQEYRPKANLGNINASTGVYSFSDNCTQCASGCKTQCFYCEDCKCWTTGGGGCPADPGPLCQTTCSSTYSCTVNDVCEAGCTHDCNASNKTHSISSVTYTWTF